MHYSILLQKNTRGWRLRTCCQCHKRNFLICPFVFRSSFKTNTVIKHVQYSVLGNETKRVISMIYVVLDLHAFCLFSFTTCLKTETKRRIIGKMQAKWNVTFIEQLSIECGKIKGYKVHTTCCTRALLKWSRFSNGLNTRRNLEKGSGPSGDLGQTQKTSITLIHSATKNFTSAVRKLWYMKRIFLRWWFSSFSRLRS